MFTVTLVRVSVFIMFTVTLVREHKNRRLDVFKRSSPAHDNRYLKTNFSRLKLRHSENKLNKENGKNFGENDFKIQFYRGTVCP